MRVVCIEDTWVNPEMVCAVWAESDEATDFKTTVALANGKELRFRNDCPLIAKALFEVTSQKGVFP